MADTAIIAAAPADNPSGPAGGFATTLKITSAASSRRFSGIANDDARTVSCFTVVGSYFASGGRVALVGTRPWFGFDSTHGQ